MSHQPFITKHFITDKYEKDENLNLSLYIDNEVFMYAIFTKNFKEIVELCNVRSNETLQQGSHADRVKFLLNNYRLTDKKFGSVNISILNNNFTILPEAFAIKESSKDILEFSSGHLPKNTFTHSFNNLNFNYFIESEIASLLERSFKNASFRHAGAVAVNLLFNNRSLKKCDLLLNFNESVFELLAKNDAGLLYYNIFNFDNKEDVLYYLLFMMEQFELAPDKAKLVIAGQLEAESELCKEIKKYVKNISFAVNDLQLNKAEDLKIPNHFYFTLLNQHLCEL